jgi:signal transduction histidine kinase
MTRVLVWSLALVVLVPFPPLVYLGLGGYRREVRAVEDEIQSTNQQIALLASNYLDSIIATLPAQAALARSGDGLRAADERAPLRWELLDAAGVIRASQIDPQRVGRAAEYRAFLAMIAAARPGTVTAGVERWIPALPPTVLMAVRPAPGGDDPGGRLVAALVPARLHAELAARLGAEHHRRIYVVDPDGRLVFYTDLELSQRGDDLRDNPPVRRYLEQRTGAIRYASHVTGQERLGYVQRNPGLGWGVIVSAPIGAQLVTLQGRYQALLWSIGFALAAALAILVWANRRLSRPVLLIRDAVRRAPAHGPLDLPPGTLRVAEYAELVGAFNELGARLARTEAELVQAEKVALLGQLASGIAHEVGTPLNVMSGYAQYLKRRVTEPESREVLDKIVHQAERLAELIRRVLDLARPTPAALQRVDLRQVIDEALELCPGPRAELDVEVTVAPDTPPVLGSPRLLEHALVNLVVNAADACRTLLRRGTVRVTAAAAPGEDARAWATCTVADDGCGIAAEHLGKIFQPFFTTKAQGHGTGLGLALVDRIARQHGGRIEVRSAPGEGTVFTMWLPAAVGPAAAGGAHA